MNILCKCAVCKKHYIIYCHPNDKSETYCFPKKEGVNYDFKKLYQTYTFFLRKVYTKS